MKCLRCGNVAEVGKMYPANTMILRVTVATLTGDDTGKSYEITLVNGSFPAVESRQTGKTFVFGFDDLANLAIAAGVDEAEVSA